ncbi:amino acid/polyamine transporter I [Linnemannia elongata]|nr:amino acid/polyamine transporter I [Linnemannia elongata]
MEKSDSVHSGSTYDHDTAVLEKLVLAGLTPLYGDALQSGGPVAVIWGWLAVSVFTLMVGLSLAEICSAYPTTGGLYFWTIKILEGRVINGVRVGSPDWVPLASWVVGYTNWLGLFLASLVTMLTDYVPSTYVIFAIYFGIIILHGIVNSLAVRLNGIFNIISVWWHVLGTALIVVVVIVYSPTKQSAEFVFTHWENNTGWTSGFYVFMLGLLQSQYTMSGYDSAAHMSEETKNAQEGGPWGIIRAIVVAFVVGWTFLIAMTFCIQDFQSQIVEPAVGISLSQMFLDGPGQTWAIILILVILGAQFFCGSALTLASSRMVYAFARDGALPLSRHLHKLDKHKSPVAAVWFNIAFCFFLGLPYIWSETAYSAIVSVNTIASSISYLIPILCRILLARESFQPGPFSLGRYSILIGVISTFWIVVTSALFLCPTEFPVTAENLLFLL